MHIKYYFSGIFHITLISLSFRIPFFLFIHFISFVWFFAYLYCHPEKSAVDGKFRQRQRANEIQTLELHHFASFIQTRNTNTQMPRNNCNSLEFHFILFHQFWVFVLPFSFLFFLWFFFFWVGSKWDRLHALTYMRQATQWEREQKYQVIVYISRNRNCQEFFFLSRDWIYSCRPFFSSMLLLLLLLLDSMPFTFFHQFFPVSLRICVCVNSSSKSGYGNCNRRPTNKKNERKKYIEMKLENQKRIRNKWK